MSRIRETASGISAEALTRRPPDGGWSIGEVLEHLMCRPIRTLIALRPLVKGVGAHQLMRTPCGNRRGGGLLASSLRSPQATGTTQLKAGADSRSVVLEEFLQRQGDVGQLLADAGTMDWRRVRVRSPVLPILSMNLGDAFTVLVVHAQRHAAQIERVKANTFGGEQR